MYIKKLTMDSFSLRKVRRQEAVRRCRKRKAAEVQELREKTRSLTDENGILQERLALLENTFHSGAFPSLEYTHQLQHNRLKALRSLWGRFNQRNVAEYFGVAGALYKNEYTMIKYFSTI